MEDMKANSQHNKSDQPSFEEAMAELEKISEELESGQLPLETSLKLYERGVRLLRLCYDFLRHAELQIDMLLGTDEEDRAITAPFDPQEMRRLAKRGKEISPGEEAEDEEEELDR